MSTSAERKVVGEAAPPLIGWPLSNLPLRARIGVLLFAVGALLIVGLVASREYPRVTSRGASEVEKQVAELFRDPTVEAWDGELAGDLLVERFYIVDPQTGERYVADLLKGKIDGVEVVPREDEPPASVFVLTTKDMKRDKAFYNAYLKAVSRPEQGTLSARYLGAIMPSGDRDAFPVNYNGELARGRVPFHLGEIGDPYSYMLGQNFKEITTPRGLNVSGYIYVLNTSDLLPVFKSEFKLDRTMFLSELLVVDATARPNKTVYYKLLEQHPRSTSPQ